MRARDAAREREEYLAQDQRGDSGLGGIAQSGEDP